MSQLNIDQAEETTFRFPKDDAGRLFDPHLRELLKKSGRKVDPGVEALAAVRILAKKMHLSMQRWADRHGLSEGRFQILFRLKHAPEGRVTMGELAEMLDVSPRTVTGLVDHLERDGLVRRVDDPHDRRSVYAELTGQGQERVVALWRQTTVAQEAITRGIRETDLIQLRHICLQLIEAMGAEEGKAHATK
jgi:DNA-binding MarR family transcriptional regulator